MVRATTLSPFDAARDPGTDPAHNVIVDMMLAKVRVFGACLVGAALLVAGCSSGSGNHATPTTTRATTTNPLPVSASVGCPPRGRPLYECILRHKPKPVTPCPKTQPNMSLTKLNAGVAGLDKELVPIAVTKVWICWNSGGRLNDGGYINPESTVVPFVRETNRISTSLTKGPPMAPAVPTDIGYQPIYLTFAGHSRQVTLRLDEDGSGAVTNGVLSGNPPGIWFGYFLAT